MRRIALLASLSAFLACAQAPDISGVWKADLDKSKIAGPPIKSYLSVISQKEGLFNRRTGEKALQVSDLSESVGEHGAHRSELTFFENNKPTVRPWEGIPTQLTGSAEADTVTVNGKVAGTRATIKRTYQLSSDGQTLTLTVVSSNEGKERQSVYVLMKQPETAGHALELPEKTAEDQFKNVKTWLKGLPASQFIDQMRYIAWSLDKDCEFCHVRNDFASDEKKEKQTARKMIDMTASIDERNFEGHPEVRCFTCHEQHPHPLAYPQFPEQMAEEHAAEQKPENQQPARK
jgi:hypothetical protein